MLFTTAEIEVLRLAGWFKAIPLSLRRYDADLFSPAGISSLCLYKLLYLTQNEQYLRLTPAGWQLLHELGYSYPKDACYITDPKRLERRDEAAKLMFTCYRAGINIFADHPEALSTSPVFLPSIAARRNTQTIGSKVWAGCRMAGIAHLGNTGYLIHFMDWQGMYFQTEMSLFHKLATGRCGQTAAIYAADSYVTAVEGILREPPPEEDIKHANGWCSFKQTAKSTLLPLCLLECSETGALQLMLMNLPNYRQVIARLALCEDYRPPQESFADFDAFSDSLGLPLLVGIDMDIKRLGQACQTARTNRIPKLMLVTMEAQTKAYKLLLATTQVQDCVELVFLSDELFFQALGRRLYRPPVTPYRTQEGGYLDATTLNLSRKAGGTNQPQT